MSNTDTSRRLALRHALPARRVALFRGWTARLDDECDAEETEGAQRFAWSGRTLYCEPLPLEAASDGTLAELRARWERGCVATFEERDGMHNVQRFAVLLERADADCAAWSLLAFVVSDGHYALLGFYFDDLADLEWAQRCWRSVQYSGCLN